MSQCTNSSPVLVYFMKRGIFDTASVYNCSLIGLVPGKDVERDIVVVVVVVVE